MKHSKSFVEAIASGDKEAADRAFKSGLSEKARAALDVRKVVLANDVFNAITQPKPS